MENEPTKIENKENVTKIVMKPTSFVKCRIGQDWYKCEFVVIFIPGKCYPDYMQVNEFVMQEIDGRELNIEEAARVLYDHLKKYDPEYLQVRNHITGCKTHFDVDVVIG